MRQLLFALALLVAPTPALAHALLDHANPAVGSVVRAPPAVLELTFDDDIEPGRCTVSLTDVTGNAVPLGPLTGSPDGQTLRAPIRTRLAPGGYQVHWRAVSIDGHVTSGEFAFRVG